ncbi:hypothetical protein ElyMa_005507100 [Elysia marginata]|uniref:Uncharacterized protein n=1 Tax=Elysia marginata TaxID=1093978 RepID=A0AAV4EUJ0_9GAST|nr:hypothetical protein ElyMa_005507100 [Elysia marginata]
MPMVASRRYPDQNYLVRVPKPRRNIVCSLPALWPSAAQRMRPKLPTQVYDNNGIAVTTKSSVSLIASSNCFRTTLFHAVLMATLRHATPPALWPSGKILAQRSGGASQTKDFKIGISS